MHYFWALGVLVVAAAAYIAFSFFSISQKARISKELIAKVVAYEQHPLNPQQRMLVAGDSTGVGVGAKALDSIAGRLGTLYPNADIENISISGLKTEGLLTELSQHLSASSSYEVILLQIGANDIVGVTNTEELRSSLRGVLELADAHAKKVIVITSGDVGLAPIFMFPFNEFYSYRSRVVRQIFIDEISKRDGVVYVDLLKEKEEEPFRKNVPRYYAPDLFHPSGEGYGLWFEELKAAVFSPKKEK